MKKYKDYKYKAKDWKKKLSKYWKYLERHEDTFRNQIEQLEKKIAHETGIKDIEFFWSDNEIVGIGNVSRTMELVDRY